MDGEVKMDGGVREEGGRVGRREGCQVGGGG